MATPRHIHIYPKCGLEIEIDRTMFYGLDYTDSKKPWKYKVTNYDEICPSRCATAEREEDIGGWLSPTARITLPPSVKANAGIPEKATSYAFMYPPEGLAETLIKRNREDKKDSFYTNPDISSPTSGSQGIESAAILGGFAYFDEECKCICINAFSTQRSERTLMFSGPYEVRQSVCDELYTLCRPHPLHLDIFHEVGFVSYAWVRPKEMFQFKSVFVTEGPMNNNGSMVFFRENGTGVAYAVNPSDSVDPTGYVGILSEAVLRIGEAKFIQQVIQPIDEVNAWGDRVKHWTNSMPTAKLTDTLKDKKRAIHMACHAVLGHEFISNVLLNVEEKHNLSYQDSFGWNPLHYACCFSPSDCILIKLLVTECPEAAVQLDVYDRSPLHIACNSDTSEEVIAILLKADTSNPKKTLTKKTRRFGLLPLHLACFNGAKYGIINALLDADHDGKTVIQKSRGGQLPLHLAILKKLPASIVKSFLDEDSKLNKLDQSSFDSGSLNFDKDVYQSFDGKLPLHLACYNNSSSEIIELLLKKDEQNTTINETVNEVPTLVNWGDAKRFPSDPSSAPPLQKEGSKTSQDISIMSQSMVGCGDQTDGAVALHLAMIHGSKGVISLILRKEMEKKEDICAGCMLHNKDILGKTPLHIACQYNVGPQIIRDMLDLDPFNKSTQIRDEQGFMPIHYACENKGTKAETIDILLDAEEQYLDEEFEKGNNICRSTHTGDTERKRTPLYLAAKSGVEAEVFVRLLQPENFLLKDFDDPTIADLAEIVKSNRPIQAQVIGRLSERVYFCFLILELYACIAAVTSFSVGSGRYISGEITLAEPTILILSTAVFILRELLQIKSTGTDYIGDLWSWFEITNIVLLLITSNTFREAAIGNSQTPTRSAEILLAITGFFVVFQLIIYLRTTFLQFARFVGGVLLIMGKLVPFLIVSALTVWAFIHAIWVTDSDELALTETFSVTFKNIFDFAPDNLNFFEILFAILIIIVLLNVVIAIVGEAWTSVAELSNGLFWQYRLEKIYELRYLLKLREYHRIPFLRNIHGYNALLDKIDSVRDISYGGHVSWTKAPYHILQKQDHYINPHKYFGPDQVKLILDAHSLRADLYWAGIENEDLTFCEKLNIMLKWFGFLTSYGGLIMLGIPTFGVFWPKKFRHSMLTLGIANLENIDEETSKEMTMNLGPELQKTLQAVLLEIIEDKHKKMKDKVV